MNHQEKYNLTWNSYEHHLRDTLSDLYSSNCFSDVTLICDDKKKISAHKNILSACSSVFKDIFETDQNPKSVIYLRGINSSEMESIVKFMYLGEATFYEDKMEDLLSVARNLQIKQLCETNLEEESQTKYHYEEAALIDNSELQLYSDMKEQKIVPVEENPIEVSYDHITKKNNDEYQCPNCNYTSKFKSNVKQHIKSIHEGKKYPCKLCDKVVTQPSDLRRHIKKSH